MLKTEDSSHLFGVALSYRMGHPKRKIRKLCCKNEKASLLKPKSSFSAGIIFVA